MSWFRKDSVPDASAPEAKNETPDERRKLRVEKEISALTDELAMEEVPLKKELLGGAVAAQDAVNKLNRLIRSVEARIDTKNSLGGDVEVMEWLKGRIVEYRILRAELAYRNGLNPVWEQLKRDVETFCGDDEDAADRRIVLPPAETIVERLLDLRACISKERSNPIGDVFAEEARRIDDALRSIGADAVSDTIRMGGYQKKSSEEKT